MQETLRDAPEQHSRDPAVAPGPNDDDIGLALFRGVGDEICGCTVYTVNDLETCIDPGLDELSNLRVEFPLNVLLVRENVSAGRAAAENLVCVHDEKLSVTRSR